MSALTPNTNSDDDSLQYVIRRSAAFTPRFPTSANRIEHILATNHQLIPFAQTALSNTRIIVHPTIPPLINSFLAHKRENGTITEKRVYQSITSWHDFVRRCIEKRPVVFFTAHDSTILRGGKGVSGQEWSRVGDEEEGSIHMDDYLTYDEMAISALIGVSAPVIFINDGDRRNRANPGDEGTYEQTGIYTGLVGARYEKVNRMEWPHTIIRSSPESGPDNAQSVWAEYYQQQGTSITCDPSTEYHFPTYEEVAQSEDSRYRRITKSTYFNIDAYKRRMRIPIDCFLLDANDRARKEGKMAYVHMVGLGLGVWEITSRQEIWFVEAVAEALQEWKLPHIGVINFSWFHEVNSCGGVESAQYMRTANGNNVRIEFSKRKPAEKLSGENEGMLLVASFAWDGNSYVGNEYWIGALAASGDPAAACCSTIGEVLNPEINPAMLENIWMATDE